jgi:hypothetical protein
MSNLLNGLCVGWGERDDDEARVVPCKGEGGAGGGPGNGVDPSNGGDGGELVVHLAELGKLIKTTLLLMT